MLCIDIGGAGANFDGRWSVVASGGQRQSASFALHDALGQPAGAASTSANSVLEGGFVVSLDAVSEPTPTVPPETPPNKVYLPLTIR